MADGQIREGFVCPMCLRDFESGPALMAHFDDAHSNDDKASSSGSSFFARVKHKTKQTLSTVAGREVDPGDRDLPPPVVWLPQEPGVARRRTMDFKALRKRRTDRNDIQVNQLVQRLEKLLYSGPMPSGLGKAALKQRKEYEQTIVAWTDDSLVPLCPDCGNTFSLMRRRHHCRTCGSVMCNDCSVGLPVEAACKLVQPPQVKQGKKKKEDEKDEKK